VVESAGYALKNKVTLVLPSIYLKSGINLLILIKNSPSPSISKSKSPDLIKAGIVMFVVFVLVKLITSLTPTSCAIHNYLH
jgi:hypothetical protein